MPRQPKYRQRKSRGCKLCGDPQVGRGIQTHVKNIHNISYKAYQKCFDEGEILLNTLIDTGHVQTGRLNRRNPHKIMIHVFVRRFAVKARKL
jgi:hypothetical protein